MSEHIGNDNEVLSVLQLILDELKTANDYTVRLNTKPKNDPEIKGVWDTPIKKVNAPIQRDFTAYHAADTVYPFGRQV